MYEHRIAHVKVETYIFVSLLITHYQILQLCFLPLEDIRKPSFISSIFLLQSEHQIKLT